MGNSILNPNSADDPQPIPDYKSSNNTNAISSINKQPQAASLLQLQQQLSVIDPDEETSLQDLNHLCQQKNWSAVEKYALVYESIYHTTFQSGSAPLHTAISNGAPLYAIQALVQANPPSVAYANIYGNLPLHFAAWKKNTALQVVAFLLQYYPQGACIANKAGDLPLHYATNFKASVETVQLIYQAHPAAIHVQNKKGKTPLENAKCRFIAGEDHDKVIALLQGETGKQYGVHEQFKPNQTPSPSR
jgi:ankyrin repeat protein